MSSEPKNKFTLSVEKLLTPDTLKRNLIVASLYLSAYEILKGAVIDQPKSFFTDFTSEGFEPGKKYKDEVRSLHKDEFQASCLWHLRNDIITQAEFDEIQVLRRHRNEIAHELASFLIDIDKEVNIHYLRAILRLLTKIDRWWIMSFELPINPDCDEVEVNEEDVKSGRMVLLDVIIQSALESESPNNTSTS
ncbi:hypothetical protein SE17_03730 [Kouleothrix aurantiaca]|uniref:Uncharacterized protein n=1 Tax=Kouleothrix aurantiaca TaxID=186479 RepID=A0A0P9D9Q8_9CHLR|nr:hypothetical protein SE17_03730 [Kouleothrix aurantiaca]